MDPAVATEIAAVVAPVEAAEGGISTRLNFYIVGRENNERAESCSVRLAAIETMAKANSHWRAGDVKSYTPASAATVCSIGFIALHVRAPGSQTATPQMEQAFRYTLAPAHATAEKHAGDFVDHRGIIDGGWNFVRLTVGDLTHSRA